MNGRVETSTGWVVSGRVETGTGRAVSGRVTGRAGRLMVKEFRRRDRVQRYPSND